MSRINTNISSIIAQHGLSRSNKQLQVHLERLSTGLRINRGADDPAGLITSERLRSSLESIGQGVKNSERASSVIATAEGALSEVSELLTSINSLVVEAANGISPEERDANQLQIDSAIASITRISNTASFADLNLLNGELGYTVSGVNDASIVHTKVHSANFLDRSDIQVDVDVLESAQQAQVFLRTGGSAASAGATPETITLEVAGPDGVDVLSFTSTVTDASIIAAINARSSITGVSAAAVGSAGSGIRVFSSAYGSDAFVSVKQKGTESDYIETVIIQPKNAPGVPDFNTPATFTKAGRDSGKDVIALINGSLAAGDGLAISARTSLLDMELVLDKAFATDPSLAAETFHITGGGALFQLGPEINSAQQVNIGIQSIAASEIGGTLVTQEDGGTLVEFLNSLQEGGKNDLRTAAGRKNFTALGQIVDAAIDEISTLRGRLGAFERNSLQTNIRSLDAAVENITAAVSVIRDADFAAETSALTRAQILSSAGTSVLATANTQAQNVLQLLG